MKFFKNLLIATTAIAAMSATAAFAAPTAEYTDGVVAVKEYDVSAMGDQVTVVIVPKGTTTVAQDDIYYINQDDQKGITTVLAGMGMKDLAEGDPTEYEVWIGGSNVSEATPIIKIDFATATAPTYVLGDVDGVAGVNVNDSTTVAKYVAGSITLTGTDLLAADVDGVRGVNVNDATAIAKYVAGSISELTPPPAE